MKMVWKSKIGICPCVPPRKLIITEKQPDGTELTTVLGGGTDTCPYCGKLWKDHK